MKTIIQAIKNIIEILFSKTSNQNLSDKVIGELKETTRTNELQEVFKIIEMEDRLKKDLQRFIDEDKQVKIVMNEKYDLGQGNLFTVGFYKFLVDFNTKGLLGKNEDYLIVQKLGE